jgi:ABC-2 type transport system permease protein
MGKEDKSAGAAKGKTKAVYPVWTLLRLTLGELVGTKRALLYLAMLLVPVACAACYAFGEKMGQDPLYLWGIIFVLAYLDFIVPLTALLLGSTLISGEQEGQTLTYLLTRPVPRWLVTLVKYAAAAGVSIVGVTLSMLGTYWMLTLHPGYPPTGDNNFVTWALLAGVGGAALLVYLAIFLFAGMRFRRPAIVGLVFILAWENPIGFLPGVVRYLTVVHYLRSLAIEATKGVIVLPSLFGIKAASVSTSLVVLGVLWVGFLALSVWYFSRGEFQTGAERR